MPSQTIEILIKLKNAPQRPLKVSIEDARGNVISRVVYFKNYPHQITCIAYNKNLTKTYLYIQNTDNETLNIGNVFINNRNVNKLIDIPIECIKPGQKKCLIINHKKPLKWGKHNFYKIENKRKEPIAGALARVYHYFPLQAWDYDNNPEMNFDKYYPFLPYPDNKIEINKYKKAKSLMAYQIIEDPACTDRDDNNGSLGSCAKEIIERETELLKNDDIHPTFLFLCQYKKPLNYYVYGELADITGLATYEVSKYNKTPFDDIENVKKAVASASPRPLIVILGAYKEGENDSRYPTPEELEISVWGAIANGAKGIMYFEKEFKTGGYNENPLLKRKISEINTQLLKIKELITISDVVELVKTDNKKIKVYSLLVAKKGIMVFVIKKDYNKSQLGELNTRQDEKINISVTIPEGMKIKAVKSIAGKPLRFTTNENSLLFEGEFKNNVHVYYLEAT
ncbi:MAG: hypothetical protein P9M03_11650 [Candidatus Theseobacter exili]|nr:hypothetical protein [Candidatus Theseobacter exili]